LNDRQRPSLAQNIQEILDEGFLFEDQKEHCTSTQPFTFSWRHGGEFVSLLTNLDDWKEQIPLDWVNEEEMAVQVFLPIHCRIRFRFLVDGNLKCDPDVSVVRGSDGGYANELWISSDRVLEVGEGNEEMQFPHLESSFFEKKYQRRPTYSQEVPDREMYEVWSRNHEPPQAPPQMFIPPQDRSSSSSLTNHVYQVAENVAFSPDVHVLSMTQKVLNKRTFIVYYKPKPMKPTPTRVASNV